STTSLMPSSAGKASRTERSAGQGGSEPARASPNRWRATVLLPQPEGPTIRPRFQGRSSRGNDTSHSSRDVWPGGRSNIDRTCSTRGVGSTGDSTVMWARIRAPGSAGGVGGRALDQLVGHVEQAEGAAEGEGSNGGRVSQLPGPPA